MKKVFIFVFIAIIFSIFVFAETKKIASNQEAIIPYRLFKTTNMWNFIQLETATGRMWQIQYDIKGDSRGSVVINDKNLAENKKSIVGRFTLHSTDNMWTFILLDQIDGDTWQVQWSFEESERFIIPINSFGY